MSEEPVDYTINGQPLERRCATVVMPVHILRTIYQMQLLRNNGRAEVLVRLNDWKIVDEEDTVHGTGFE
jgi:hypothetical protein